jgi:hypothetical protein
MLNVITTIREARPEDASSLAILMTELGYPTSPRDMSERLAMISEQKEYRLFVFETQDGLLAWLVRCEVGSLNKTVVMFAL